MNVAMVKELRALTGAGPLDCQRALQAHDGDLMQAVEYLRAKGLAKAAQKAERDTRTGIVVIHSAGDNAAMVEVNCETDFVARTDEFRDLAHRIAEQIATDPDFSTVEALMTAPYSAMPDRTVGQVIQELIGRLGENIVVSHAVRFSGLVETYIHAGEVGGYYGALEGRIGVLLELQAVDQPVVRRLAHNLALHIASVDPDGLTPETLLAQPYIRNEQISIQTLVEQASAELGSPIRISRFARFEITG